MLRSFRLDEVDGELAARPGSILRATELRLDGQLVPRDRFGTWTLAKRDGTPIRLSVHEDWLDFRLLATCAGEPSARVVAPGIPRWLAWLALVPALLALPNLCAGPAGLCGMAIPFVLSSINRSIARRADWSAGTRAVLASLLTLIWLGLQVALVTWAAGVAAHRHAP